MNYTKNIEEKLRELLSVSCSQASEKTVTVTETVTSVKVVNAEGTVVTVPIYKTITSLSTRTLTSTVPITRTVTETRTETVTLMGGVNVTLPESFPLEALLKETIEKLTLPNEIYEKLGKASGPLADEIRKEMQKRAWIIAELSRMANTLLQFQKYLADYYDAKAEADAYLSKPATYESVFKILMDVQRMWVDLAMANKVLTDMKAQMELLRANKPSVDYKAISAKIGDPKDFLINAIKQITTKELIEIR